jgi:TrmH family RNA methyltransferase
MTTNNDQPLFITSRDNAWLKSVRKLVSDGTAYRQHGRFWLEGEHLCVAARQKKVMIDELVFSESYWHQQRASWKNLARRIVVLTDEMFESVSGLDSPGKIACVCLLPERQKIQPDKASVVLDRVQDAGNVGSILRSAAAFGVRQVLAVKGTAGLWSPKVLRAGMGAHFSLDLHEGLDEAAVEQLQVPWLATSSHQGPFLHELQEKKALPYPAAWFLGHEGQGVRSEWLNQADLTVRIGQPGGEESLNVAAAAAICLHAHLCCAGYNERLFSTHHK